MNNSNMNNYTNLTDEELLKDFHKVQLQLGELYNKQKALKILLNTYYGASGFSGFRYFDIRNAMSVTLGGQAGIKIAANKTNEFLNKECGFTEFQDLAIGGDTDSYYINFGPVAEHFGFTTDQEIDKYIKEILEPVIDKAMREYFEYLNHFDFRLNFKREVIARKGFFLDVKKRYGMLVTNSEGVQLKDPELKVVGVEVLRSSTPSGVKQWMKPALLFVVMNDRKGLVEYLTGIREQYEKLPLEEIAQNSSVSNLSKYLTTDSKGNITIQKPKSESGRQLGIPIASMAAINWNDYIRRKKLTNQYEYIREKSKIKILRLKPNPYGYETIGYEGYFPLDFDLVEFIDKDLMFEKTYKQAIRNVTDCFSWDLDHETTIYDL